MMKKFRKKIGECNRVYHMSDADNLSSYLLAFNVFALAVKALVLHLSRSGL